MREHIRWVHASNIHEYPDPAPYKCHLCNNHLILMDREELCLHIVKHSDQIATITKLNAKQNNPFNTESKQTTQKPSNTHAQLVGVKCDQNIIEKNRNILEYIDKCGNE